MQGTNPKLRSVEYVEVWIDERRKKRAQCTAYTNPFDYLRRYNSID